MSLSYRNDEVMAVAITDITNSILDVRGLFTVDNDLQLGSGLTKKIDKYTYTGSVETLSKGEANTSDAYGSVNYTTSEYTVSRKQHPFKYFDDDAMSNDKLLNILTDGAGKTMANQFRSEYYTELAKIANHFDVSEYSGLYDAVVDAVAALPKASELDTTDLFVLMGADMRAKVRKDPLFEASRQGEILYTGQFGTIAGIPCVYSNLIPFGTVYVTEKKAITCFIKKEGTVETARNIQTKETEVVYSRYGLVALTDETRSVVMEANISYSEVDSSDEGYSTSNPSTQFWFEKTAGGIYFPSADEEVVGSKTYYEKI